MGNAANPSAEILRRKTTCAANETSHDSNMPTSAAPNIDTNASLGAHLINTKMRLETRFYDLLVMTGVLALGELGQAAQLIPRGAPGTTNEINVTADKLSTGDGSVNSADISQAKSQSGRLVTSANFREDVTTEGSINSADISLVKSKSGTALP